EASAQRIIATAHRSKGREWDRVRLADDLAEHLDTAREAVADGGTLAHRTALADELTLCYVAVTRARTALAAGQVIPDELYTAATTLAAAPSQAVAPIDVEHTVATTVTVEFTEEEAARLRAVAGDHLAEWLHQ